VKKSAFVALVGMAGLGLVGCGGEDSAKTSTTPVDLAEFCTSEDATGSITVYSGRSETLVADFFNEFEAASEIDIDVRYGDSAELAGQILTEGASTPADVFFSQDAGALGALANADLLTELPSSILDRVGEQFRSSESKWVGTSGRVRVVVYNTEIVSAPPTNIDSLLTPQWKGKIGFAPTNASWQSFVTALRVIRGDDAAREWLEGFAANDPVAYEKNSAVRDAVNAGQVSIGLVNHYYLYELIAAEGDAAVVAENQFMDSGDVGGLINVAGMGVLGDSDSAALGQCLVAFALSDAGQNYFVERSYEYPLVEGIAQYQGLPAFDELNPPALDLSDLESLDATQELLADVGLLTD